MKSGGEYDTLTPFGKKYHNHRPGERKYWKNKVNRRNRRFPNLMTWAEDEYYLDELTNAENYDYFYV